MYKKRLLTLAMIPIAILFFTTPSLADINRTCLDNETLQINTTYYIETSDGLSEIEVSKNEYCAFGCTNGECEGSSVEGDMAQIWLTFGAGTVMLVLGVVLGLPFGKFAGEEKGIKKPFNTTMVVKYIFFFLGFFLVYLSFGMVRRLGSVYGGESNITDAVDTATMTMMITMIVFLIVFVVEFIFYVIKRQMEMVKEKKWGIRENEE